MLFCSVRETWSHMIEMLPCCFVFIYSILLLVVISCFVFVAVLLIMQWSPEKKLKFLINVY